MTRKNAISLIFFMLTALQLTAQNPADTMKIFITRATFYSDIFNGRRTSSGEIFKQTNYTAAHHSLPFGTLVLVTNPETGSQVIVKVNDRCPRGGIIDLTKQAAKAIGVGYRTVEAQILPVRYEAVWKRQDKLAKEMRRGTLLAAINDTIGHSQPKEGKNKSRKSINEEKSNSKELLLTIADSDITADVLTDTISLYQIDLDVAANRHEAELLIDKLPMKFQNTAEVLPSGKSPRLRITLDLNLPLADAKLVQSELKDIFPNSKLRKIAKSKQISF